MCCQELILCQKLKLSALKCQTCLRLAVFRFVSGPRTLLKSCGRFRSICWLWTLLTDDRSTLAVLGLSWCPLRDCFIFKIEAPTPIEVCTKKTMLSKIARLFDPMGWLAPVKSTDADLY